MRVPQDNLKAAWKALPGADKDAINTARKNIKKFHQAQIPKDIEVETTKGVICRREARAIGTAGLYVPGGTAPLVSTLLMLAIPAKVAGVKRRIVVTPPGKDGTVNPAILAAAYRCKVTDVFICGGAQAIAALCYGTETIPKCDKIFGPGNAYVAAAKALAAQAPGGPAIDMPAGPSEAMVVANDKANPIFVASDLLSQAEHDTLAQVVCVVTNQKVADAVKAEINRQITTLPRKDIAEKSITQSRMIIADNRGDVADIINRYAPEHLILQITKPETLVPAIRNAGSIFLGPWTPEAVGDYASGTNHTLPTNGAARAYSGVTTESFIKYISVQKLSRKGLQRLGPTVERLAAMEGLEAHRRAISLRLESVND
jgi:histidinol dehydrogenase